MASWNEKTGWGSLVAGGIAGVLASTCCLGAPVLAGLGFGGAYLAALEPYWPVFTGVGLAALFFAYRGLFRSAQACQLKEGGGARQVNTGHKVAFWMVAALVGIGLAVEGIEKTEAGFDKKAVVASAGSKAGMPAAGGDIPHLTRSEILSAVARSPVPVLVQFDAAWCPYCRALQPHLDKLREKKGSAIAIYKVDFDKERELVEYHGVSTLPTLIMFYQGKIVGRAAGAMEERELFDWVGGIEMDIRKATPEAD